MLSILWYDGCTLDKVCEELFLNTFDKPYLYTIYHNLDAICFINLIYYRITCIFVNSKFTGFAAFHESTSAETQI